MRPNNSPVTTDVSYAEEADNLLAYAEHLEREIEVYRGEGERTLNARISEAHNALNVTLKRADILSNLAIVEAIDHLADEIGAKPAAKESHSRAIYLAALADGNPDQ